MSPKTRAQTQVRPVVAKSTSAGRTLLRSPRKFAVPTAEGELSSTVSVTAVVRAVQLLEAFDLREAHLNLTEFTRRTGLHKTTVLRIARTLAREGYLVQREDGDWRLGPAAGWLGARYQSAFDIQNVVEPMLRDLVRLTGESAAFYVREGDFRACVVRVEGPHPLRHHARIGEALPLDRGSPGRVILAFSGETGEPYDLIRVRGFHLSIGEREKDVATVSAPVFGPNWRLLGSVCISGPVSRLPENVLMSLAGDVMNSANLVSYSLAGATSPNTPIAVSTWHP